MTEDGSKLPIRITAENYNGQKSEQGKTSASERRTKQLAIGKTASHLVSPETQDNDNANRQQASEVNKREVIQSIDFGSDVAEHEAKALARYFVETDQWARIFAGQVDVIYGAKGSGKSAIYHLMMNKEGEFFDRDILLVPAENPDEDPAFMEIRSDLPPTEEEFTGLWKLYFCSVAAVRARDAGVSNGQLREVLDHLAGLNLIEKHVSLNTIIRNISGYVARFFRPSDVSATSHFDPTSGALTGSHGESFVFGARCRCAPGGCKAYKGATIYPK